MIEFEGSAVVERPVAEVFSFISNPANIPQYQDKVLAARVVSPGPLGKGTQFTETVQMGPGKVDVTCEIVAYEAPRRVAFIARSNVVHCDAEYVFESVAGGTRVSIAGRATLQGWRRFLEPLMRGEIRKGVPRELEAIRARLTAMKEVA